MNQARTLLLSVCLAFAALPAAAQGRPARPQPTPTPAAAPAPPPMILCRTAEEVCFLGVVVNGQIGVIFTNAPNADSIGAKPLDVTGPDGSKLDMTANAGRVVMLTGTYDAKTGITKAEVVEVASPLVSLVVKAQLGGGDAPGGGKGTPRRGR